MQLSFFFISFLFVFSTFNHPVNQSQWDVWGPLCEASGRKHCVVIVVSKKQEQILDLHAEDVEVSLVFLLEQKSFPHVATQPSGSLCVGP